MKFLVFQHVEHEHPGLIADWARERGVELQVIELWKPYKLPKLADVDALVIMGGPMGVYEGPDVFPSKQDELKFIKEALNIIPIIGFCLGSQLLANALGANVHPNLKDGKKIKEIGYYTVDLTQEAQSDPIFKGFTSPVGVFQWHGDAFDMPQNAILLATSTDYHNQAFRYGKFAYAMTFHNEFTPEMVESQIEIDKKWIHDGFNMNEEKLRQQAHENKDRMERQCYQLFDNFLSLVPKKA